ncbi:MAG TPA: hypothetical protein VFC39_22450 [Acidobacteriaceae bacterium]|nr:hypothetical protein [Acidobacteriaceae bacterium]
MIRHEFEDFWREPNKCVTDDIIFRLSVGYGAVYSFDDIPVICQSDMELAVHGSYSCLTRAMSYNFTIKGVGPITRYCAGGPEHHDSGRYHHHLLRHESDPRQNLPYAEARPTLEGMSALEIWKLICIEGNISHTGTFYEPEVMCQ